MGSMIDAGMGYDKLGMSDEAIGIACIACHSLHGQRTLLKQGRK